MSFTRAGDLFYTLRIIALLTTPWEKQAAFKQGIIDEKGKLLKKTSEFRTADEKDAYTYLHRMVFNMKRLLQKAPGGSSFIAAATASVLLLREGFGEHLTVEQIKMIEERIYSMDLGEDAVAGAPTNVTGDAVSTNDVKLPLGSVKRRKNKTEPSKKESKSDL